MPGRDPEAQERSRRVGEAIRAIMRQKDITGVQLRELIEKRRGEPVSASSRGQDVWLSRRLLGDVNLVQPVKVVYGPTDDLEDIAAVLGTSADRLVRAANATPKPKPAPKTADQ